MLRAVVPLVNIFVISFIWLHSQKINKRLPDMISYGMLFDVSVSYPKNIQQKSIVKVNYTSRKKKCYFSSGDIAMD